MRVDFSPWHHPAHFHRRIRSQLPVQLWRERSTFCGHLKAESKDVLQVFVLLVIGDGDVAMFRKNLHVGSHMLDGITKYLLDELFVLLVLLSHAASDASCNFVELG